MTNPRDDGEADDIAKQEAESVADAKRRLAKRSGTNPRDDGVAVAPCTCGQSGHGNAHDPDCPRSDYKPIKSERQEAMAARDEIEDVVRCLREACAYINITEQVRGYHSAASNGLVVDAADLIDRLSRQLAEAQGVIERQNAVIEAAIEFRDKGTVLTACNRGPCQRVVERDDKSDPQYKLFSALKAHAAAMGTTK